ncbi:RNA polymerase ECF-type sigma factor [Arcticibacter svalbardensis MN12-7]|uniref:RNA polymerase ECF-type sigma factor n=1 Tax=Arcticibacter svalbardensis MN12-7 TaxID=1150600 RepID=R9GVU8_9SPHI|nr:sigma-70 family RNA polymerase sigma factor [Arcticibacter svalbardensis]EOR93054.1 RNA polymerase ECF-type sigma factor [Arcticibacter svalbardensis MN12-7]
MSRRLRFLRVQQIAKSEDAELVGILSEGFESLYWNYHQLIYLNIYKFVKNKEESQDILQDVFVTLWESRAMIKEQSVSGWLFVISFNKALNHIKKKQRITAVQDQVASAYISSHEREEDTLDGYYQILKSAIADLSPQKQKVFKLCKLEGRSYEEAAEELNISRHTVKEYLSLAMFSVRDAFKTSTGLYY